MSQRGKRGNRLDNENNAPPHQQTQQPPSKRRKGRPTTTTSSNSGGGSADPDQEMSTGTTTIPVVSAGVQPNLSSAQPSSSSSSTMWQARSITDLKIYNRSSSEAPAELFRKDLISAMKLPDSEPLSTDEYWIITDQWKQEWERGVQVPVNPDSLPEPSVKTLSNPIAIMRHDFKLPKNKYVRITKDENFSSEQHFLTNAPVLAETACSYDLDQVDEVWLRLVNSERALCGLTPISDGQFERVIEELEVRCWEKIQAIIRNEEGLGIEYDENVICDVCRSPDSEEANEMVFCDNCNICVHQACYGITVIPSGQWLCRTCAMGKKPDCALCPNKGGAMKSTRSGKKWAHVSCALWIPEVSIGSVDKMEPITKISSIPQTRWSLLCILCRERVGACIQCSVSTCKTAYHVTCAFQHGLEMRAIIEEGNAEDGVKLRSYCLKHCNAKGKKEKGTNNNGSGSDDDCRRRKMRSDMTSEERNQARLMRSKEVEAEFDKHVNIKDISFHLLDVDQEAITAIYSYWILKRKSVGNRSLIPPKADDSDMLPNRQDQADMEKKIMFVHLRQDLERVRNLCYMVNRREKLSRSFFKMREQIFYKQIAVLSESSSRNYDSSLISAIFQANNGSSVYDKCYSSSPSSPAIKIEEIQDRILGLQQLTADMVDRSCLSEKSKKNSKFKKIHLNGLTDRRGDSVFEDSCLSSTSEAAEKYRLKADNGNTSSKKASTKKKAQSYSKILEKHKRRKSLASSVAAATAAESSSEDENNQRKTTRTSGPKKNPSLHQMEKELAKENEEAMTSSDDSDLLMPIRQTNNQLTVKKSHKPIYSDSDSTDKEKTDNTISDSQQQMFRTKAAMKEFSLQAASKQRQDVKRTSSSTSPTKPSNKLSSSSSSNKHKSPERKKQNDRPKAKPKPPKPAHADFDSDEKSEKKCSSQKEQKSKENESPAKQQQQQHQSKEVNKKFPTDLLVVPQRKAAIKASENMRSTNSYVAAATGGPKKDAKSEERDNEFANTTTAATTTTTTTPTTPKIKEKGKEKEQRDYRDDDRDKEKSKDREKDRGKPRGRPPKQLRDEPTKDHSAVASSSDKEQQQPPFPKEKRTDQKTLSDSQKSEKSFHKKAEKSDSNLMVACVPQRKAAKKAAEHIKSGLGKVVPIENAPATQEERDKDQSKDSRSDREKEKGNKLLEIELFRDREKDRDRSKDTTTKIEKKDKDLDKTTKYSTEKDEKTVKSPTRKPSVSKDKKAATILLTSSSSGSSSSSSYSSTSSGESDENDESFNSRKQESIVVKSKSPERSSPLKNILELSPQLSDSGKPHGNTQSDTPKTVDSDVLCIDDSPDSMDKKTPKSTESNSPLSDTGGKEFDMDRHDEDESLSRNRLNARRSPIELKESRRENASDNYTTERLFGEKMDLIADKENAQTLEEEMAQRKADLTTGFQTGGFKSKTNRNAGSLDKFLNKKEKERKEQKDTGEKIDAMDLEDSLRSLKDISAKELAISAKNSASKSSQKSPIKSRKVTEVIDIDSESAESAPSKSDQSEVRAFPRPGDDIDMKTSPVPFSLASFLPDPHKDVMLIHEKIPAKEDSPNPMHPAANIAAKDIVNEEFQKHHSSSSSSSPPLPPPEEVAASKGTTCGEFEPIFESKPSEEDSARETMNLVEKLRQKYKRSSSKIDEPGIPSTIAEMESKSGSNALPLYHTDIFPSASIDGKLNERSAAKEIQSIFEKETSKIDSPPPPSQPATPTTVNKSQPFVKTPISESAINFFSKSQLHCDTTITQNNQMKDAVAFVAAAAAAANMSAAEKTTEMFVQPKSMEKSMQKSSADSFDSLTQANFFKGDFVDMHEKDSTLEMNTNSSKLADCDYDENTRMQSPYTNPENMWNENNLIQTRRSVSSSPSSISESNDEFKVKANVNVVPVCKANEAAMHHALQQQHSQASQQQHPLADAISNDPTAMEKNSFGLVSSFNISQPQFPLQHQQPQSQSLQPQPQLQHPHQQQPPHQHQIPQPGLTSYMNGADVVAYNYPENNHYNGSVSLFPTQSVPNLNTQMPPFPSPSTPIFPSALGSAMSLSQTATQSNTSIFDRMDKHKQPSADPTMPYSMLPQSCAATFTSSSDNLALTQEIVANNVPSVPLTASQMMNDGYNVPPVVSNIIRNNVETNAALNQMMNCDVMSNNNVNNLKDSPSKRQSSRFNQIKSPSMHKSPGKSPRNMEMIANRSQSQNNNQKTKYEANQRSKSRSTRGGNTARGRGRGRGRGRVPVSTQIGQSLDFDNTMGMPNHLAGTVYDLDFDEDLSTSVDLKSMRDRRRSFDSRMSGSNNVTSPGYQSKHRNTNLLSKSATDMKSPRLGSQEPDLHTSHSYLSNMHPVLPGPVDMRTYNSGYENQATTATQEAYNNHLLGVFAIGMPDQTLNEIDEEDEKKLQSDLKASGTYKPKPPAAADIIVPESHASIETTSEEISLESDQTISKVSLSDSRNQLKLKIKGPLARPDNYNTQSSCGTLNQPLTSDTLSLQITSASTVTSSNSTTGTSSLRRMRKKELLRQYWTQDMNMDDATSLPPAENKANNDPILSRNVGIPKAIDSMSTIPTKDDYKDYASMDPRKRKRMGGISRELRQLDNPYEPERPERRRSICSTGSNMSANNIGGDPLKVSLKRRSKKLDSPNSGHQDPPKLKIKIGNHVETITDGTRIVGCPPKKRPTANQLVPPTLEILKRDCMNYRKQVMADFGDDDEIKDKKQKMKAKKESKPSSHKKRKKDKSAYLRIMKSTESSDATKLIIRIGKRKAQDDTQSSSETTTSAMMADQPIDPLAINSNNPDPFFPEDSANSEPSVICPSIKPIKLKFARKSDGDGYVIGQTKRLNGGSDDTDEIVSPTIIHKRLASDNGGGESNTKNFTNDPLRLGSNLALSTTAAGGGKSMQHLSQHSNAISVMNKVNDLKGGSQRHSSKTATGSALSSLETTTTTTTTTTTSSSTSSSSSSSAGKAGCPLLPLNKDCEVR